MNENLRDLAVAAAGRTLTVAALIKGAVAVVGVLLVLLIAIVPLFAGSAATGTPGSGDAGGTTPCEDCGGPVSDDAIAMATQLRDGGRLIDLPGDYNHVDQIYAMIPGDPRAHEWPGCQIDVRVLQLLTKLTARYTSVGVSSINRKCSGELLGAGVYSAHYADGGGHAIDLYAINGSVLTGNDTYSRELVTWADGFVPQGSRTGQIQCRSANPLPLHTFGQFVDGCNHVHIDFNRATGDLQ